MRLCRFKSMFFDQKVSMSFVFMFNMFSIYLSFLSVVVDISAICSIVSGVASRPVRPVGVVLPLRISILLLLVLSAWIVWRSASMWWLIKAVTSGRHGLLLILHLHWLAVAISILVVRLVGRRSAVGVRTSWVGLSVPGVLVLMIRCLSARLGLWIVLLLVLLMMSVLDAVVVSAGICIIFGRTAIIFLTKVVKWLVIVIWVVVLGHVIVPEEVSLELVVGHLAVVWIGHARTAAFLVLATSWWLDCHAIRDLLEYVQALNDVFIY